MSEAASNSPVMATSKFANEGHIVKRNIVATIKGSMHEMQMGGPTASSWSAQNGQIGQVLGVNDLIDGCADGVSLSTLLQNAHIISADLIEYHNKFPVSLGVNLSCIPGKEATRTGCTYAFTALPTAHNTVPLNLYTNDHQAQEGVEWRTKYPMYNASNLETQGVLNVQGENFYFIDKGHPCVELLRMNKHVLNADIDQQPLIDNQWFKVMKQVMATCCNHLRKVVLNKVSTMDLNNLTLQISRLDNAKWVDYSTEDELMLQLPASLTTMSEAPNDSELFEKWKHEQTQNELAMSDTLHKLTHEPRTFTCRIALTFQLLPTAV
jgi:hypothetical protein